jgi:alpha-beta hydrolase superfamily lysophospholipase
MSPIIHRLMLYPLIILAVIYTVLIFLALRSDRMIFLPQPSSYSDRDLTNQRIIDGRNVYTPTPTADSPYKMFKLATGTGKDAATITALYLPNPDARFTLLMSHGNAEDFGENRDLYAEYATRGFAIFAYDYRGYGTSTGTSSERSVNLDERAAWDFMVNSLHIPPSRIIIHGTSVGCGPAVELAAQLSSLPIDQRPAALVLRSPFRSAFTVLTHVPLLPWDKFNNARRIRDVRMPVLVIHGMNDTVIPFAHGQAVFHNAAPIGDQDAPLTSVSGKQHLWIPNAGHNDIFVIATQTYFTKLQSFAAQLP